jgi:hypothetical protein
VANVTITIKFDMRRKGHFFEVLPEGDFDPDDLSQRVCDSLLDSVTAIMSSSGLAKWQIVENLQMFVDDLNETASANFAKSLRVIQS